jgi:hypothetical protein
MCFRVFFAVISFLTAGMLRNKTRDKMSQEFTHGLDTYGLVISRSPVRSRRVAPAFQRVSRSPSKLPGQNPFNNP